MTIPTREEINVYNSLDEQARWCMDFLGKTVEEAEELFRRNSLRYQEGLMWMGPAAFRYYVHALIRYIQSEESSNDADIINCFAGLLEFRSECDMAPVAKELFSVCDYVVEHYDRFDLTQEIYGDVRSRFELLRQKFGHLSSPASAA